MPSPNANYRENPKRAVYLTGRIDQGLVDKITPVINELRHENTEPITAYIDSPGGSIVLAETIRHQIRTPNPDGKKCRLITVVISRAGSAAADLLALGDYAIAYPYGDMIYHGSSQSSDIPLTTESAIRAARSLQQTNEDCAIRLARHTFPRFILRITQLRPEMAKYVNDPTLTTLTNALRGELSSANARMLREAVRKQRIIGDLNGYVFRHIRKFKNHGADLTAAEWEGEMLRAIVKYRIKLHKDRNDSWLLSESGIQEVTEDFNLLHDFHYGSQTKDLTTWDKTYGEMFLSDAEKQERLALTGSEAEKEKWLIEKSEMKLRPLWYLMISICRLLQGADYRVSPEEGYWLGLVDEVLGSSLPCVRHAAEAT
jgi:ATP-dependent protease ClpP protease subunit